MLFLGSWVRVIGFKQHGFPLVVISQAIYGFAFPCIVETTVTQMANNWFPENERATASSIVFVAMVAGTAGMELLGPAMVSGRGNSSIVSSIGSRSSEEQSLSELADAVLRAVNSDVEMKALENQFLRFYLVQAAVITVVALLTFTTFKGEPEKPPNFSSFIKKTSSASNNSMKGFAKAVLECFKTGPFYPLFLGYGIEYGAAEGMLTIMNPMLIPEGYTTKEAGYCGLAYFGIGFFGSFVAAAIADRTKMYKAVLRVSAIGIAGTAALVYTQIKPNNLLLLVLTMSLHSFFMNAVSATTFDALVEVTYPINETVTASLTSIFGCVLTVVLTNIFLSMKDDKPPYSLKKAFLLYVVLDIISCICYSMSFHLICSFFPLYLNYVNYCLIIIQIASFFSFSFSFSFSFFLSFFHYHFSSYHYTVFQFGANKRFETETSESTKSTETSHMTADDLSQADSLEDGEIEEIVEEEFNDTDDDAFADADAEERGNERQNVK